MSLTITASLTCDRCGLVITSKPEHRATWCNMTVGEVKQIAFQGKWLTVNRGRFYVPAHYCPECADKPAVILRRKS